MYTQCPDCATVFRVTAEALRAAHGDVRCGVCSTSFNALENLSERPFLPAEEEPVPSPDDSMTVEELPGNENIELSSPVELTTLPDTPARPADADSAEPEEDRALEFHGDAADLDRLFVVEAPEISRFDPASAAAALSAASSDAVDDDELERTDEHPILVLDEQDEPIEEEASVESIVLETLPPPPPPPPSPPPAAAPAPTAPPRPVPAASPHTAPRILIPDEMRQRLAEEAAARAAAAGDFELAVESRSFLPRRWPWVAGIATLAVLLVLQILHRERDDLARSPTLGQGIAAAYALLGLPRLSPTDLSAYELRSWGAASDPNEPSRLLLRASIVNRATYAQPLPVLRLVLQDRFGGTLGTRDIGPADYLPHAGGPGLLEPGERADALIRIVDPGTEAVGFELDVCLAAKSGVRCAHQITTAGP